MKFLARGATALLSLAIGALATQNAAALTFDLPGDGSNIVGKIRTVQTITGDTLASLGRRYEVGLYELKEANPSMDFDTAYGPGKTVLIPTQFILPNTPHKGIVVNLAELRLYFYQPNTREVITFPVGVGRDGWNSPVGQTYIASKSKDPVWHVPESIKEERLKDGVVLPDHVDPGPDNPLGGYRLRLGFAGYLIHGSNDPNGIGRRSSSGCIRMQPEAIESFFNLVPVNFMVTLVDEPVKVGWLNNDLYIESHVPLTGNSEAGSAALEKNLHQQVDAAIAKRPADINWTEALKVLHQQRGYPVKIGEGTGPIPQEEVPVNPDPIVKVNTTKETAPHKKGSAKTKHKKTHVLSGGIF
jgi:L,D-transpeptidase ErfK/SrfK